MQAKATDSPIDRVVLDQLISVQNFRAEQGLLVSWSGFKQSIERERAQQFFRVRLWNREDILERSLLQRIGIRETALDSEDAPVKSSWPVRWFE